jgi:hypothetical protein
MSVLMESRVFQEFRPGRILYSVTELFYVAASVAEESSGGKIGVPAEFIYLQQVLLQKGV